jgi:hypothetical protein
VSRVAVRLEGQRGSLLWFTGARVVVYGLNQGRVHRAAWTSGAARRRYHAGRARVLTA